MGVDLRGKTLGVLGLGNVGSEVARIGSAFGMKLIAWSQNMTAETAKATGAILVSKDQLFERADILGPESKRLKATLTLRGFGCTTPRLERTKPATSSMYS